MMRHAQSSQGISPRYALVAISLALAAATIPACRAGHSGDAAADPLGRLPPQAWAAPPADAMAAGYAEALPLPYEPVGPWAPPGLDTPWPPQEYLRDGGDAEAAVAVAPNWDVEGLDVADAVAHYDTVDGRTLVEPSNQVFVYAPRFASVRSVVSPDENDQVDQVVGVRREAGARGVADSQLATTGLQRWQAERQTSSELPGAFLTRQGDGAVSSQLGPAGFQDAYLPFEDLEAIRSGRMDQADKARLAEGLEAAVAWTHGLGVQVLLNGEAASMVSDSQGALAVYTVQDLRNAPKLRLIKVASTQTAQPGDTIDFTLRFDNVGDQPIGNVVILDNLVTRLEYVEGSAQSSLTASFSTEANEADSTVLRWEIADPIEPGDGGVVRFTCRVR
jgi:uncharacterized repeat protein (TIGR01451 family)